MNKNIKKKKFTGVEDRPNSQAPPEVRHQDYCHPDSFFLQVNRQNSGLFIVHLKVKLKKW
jgi:hypothetical protein